MEDNNAVQPSTYISHNISNLATDTEAHYDPETVMIIGTNKLLSKILCELDDFFTKGSKVILANTFIDKEYEELASNFKNIVVEFNVTDIEAKESIETLFASDVDYVILLSDDACEDDASDAKTLLKLINIRDIAQKKGQEFTITSELKLVQNQKLAKMTNVNDLVIGSDVINLIVSQISEDRDLSKVFTELLDAEGAEIHIRPIQHYLKTNIEMDFYSVTEILKQKDEIAIGYKVMNGDAFEIITNPNKSDKIIFKEEDSIITLANE